LGTISFQDLFQKLMDDSGYEAYLRVQGDQERLDNAAELKRAIADYGRDPESTVDDFLSKVALFTAADNDSQQQTIKLMSIHAAKGLEFNAVFLIGLGEGSLPSRQTQTPDEMAEERRLCYVAMTRAKDRLFLSNSSGRTREGVFSYTSRFVYEMNLENLSLETHPGAPPDDYSPLPDAATPVRLSVGQIIYHPVWGQGVILAVSARDAGYQVQFDRFTTSRSLRFDAPISTADLKLVTLTKGDSETTK
jgi:DNA helicase-2/ATP-dependent DNA helicase PcrA